MILRSAPTVGIRDPAVGKEERIEHGVPLPSDVLCIHGDNEVMIQVCRSGRNPTMRHMGRTHGISCTWLHDETSKPTIDLRYIVTADMAADIFTMFSRRVRN